MQTKDGWLLIAHKDHARLAGEIGRFWGNATFAEPDPRAQVLHAVTRHDDAWASRAATPGPWQGRHADRLLQRPGRHLLGF